MPQGLGLNWYRLVFLVELLLAELMFTFRLKKEKTFLVFTSVLFDCHHIDYLFLSFDNTLYMVVYINNVFSDIHVIFNITFTSL